jgi:hypothetical protein
VFFLTKTRHLLIAGFLILAVIGGAAGLLFLVPNFVGEKIIGEAKAKGYLDYTPEEAVELAYGRCTGCHSDEKIVLYCARCGPPFIVVSHFMKKYVEVTNQQDNGMTVEQFTDAELVAITQVWNALIGNWEGDWPLADLEKLLDGDRPLVDLLATPVTERPIETALRDRSAPGSYKEETRQIPPARTGEPAS